MECNCSPIQAHTNASVPDFPVLVSPHYNPPNFPSQQEHQEMLLLLYSLSCPKRVSHPALAILAPAAPLLFSSLLLILLLSSCWLGGLSTFARLEQGAGFSSKDRCSGQDTQGERQERRCFPQLCMVSLPLYCKIFSHVQILREGKMFEHLYHN